MIDYAVRRGEIQTVQAHQVVKSSGHSLGVDPQLPFSRVAVPRLTHVVPFEQLLRVVDPVYGVPVDRQRVIGLFGRVLDPRVYHPRLTGICTIQTSVKQTHTHTHTVKRSRSHDKRALIGKPKAHAFINFIG